MVGTYIMQVGGNAICLPSGQQSVPSSCGQM